MNAPELAEVTMTDEQKKMNLLIDWTLLVREVATYKPIIEREQELRKQVMTAFFPDAAEGVNAAPLQDGWTLKGTRKIERKVDEPAWPAIKEELKAMGVVADGLVRFKPEVETKVYKALSEEAKKVFEHALIIKDGSPTLELVAPKEKK